jgi:hypothetical protein
VKVCSITVDVDSLNSNFKGFGLRKTKYSYKELEYGFRNILVFFARHNVKATFFVVAGDVEIKRNAGLIKTIVAEGHEIASHSYSHPQGFRLLSPEKQEFELRKSKEILEAVSGQEIIGFRSPGWNISDESLAILRSLGYRYDSSVFPTSLAPILKLLHFRQMRKRDWPARTTMGHLYYVFAPSYPYHPEEQRLGKRGNADFVEFPVQVTGLFRLPFFATLHLAYPAFFKKGYDALRARKIINYQMHLSDFVDYGEEAFQKEIPRGSGSYIPLSLKSKLSDKMLLWKRIFAIMSQEHTFRPLKYCVERFVHIVS